jgi:hypothetical protein
MQRGKLNAKYSEIDSGISININSNELSLAYSELDKLIKLADTMDYALVKIYARRIENHLNKIEVCQMERQTQVEI